MSKKMTNQNLKEKYDSRYDLVYPEFSYRNRCFYCGDYEDTYDYFPTLYTVHLYQETTPHYKIPSCNECYELLLGTTQDDLKERRDVVQQLLRNKYKNILSSGMQWSNKELEAWKNDDSGSLLLKQVSALKEEFFRIKERVSFKGYQFEYKGSPCEKGELFNIPEIVVNDLEYSTIEDAVLNISEQLKINIDKIYTQLSKGLSLQAAYDTLEYEKTLNVELKKLAKKYPKKNKDFLKSAVNRISKQKAELSIYEVIEFFEVNYLMTPEQKIQHIKSFDD